VTFTGAADLPGSDSTLQAIARPDGSIPCQPTLADDQIAAGTNAQVIADGVVNPLLFAGEPFSLTAPFTPTQTGKYLVCSWISQTDPATTLTTIVGPTSTIVSVRPPQVKQLSVKFPAHPVPGKAFPVRWTTKTDQTLTLYGVISFGHSCRLNDAVELGHDPQAVNFEPGAAVYGGPVSTSAQAAVATPGRYVMCTWLEGPIANEVVAHQATRFTVAPPRTARH
jgi:hypothetical protein